MPCDTNLFTDVNCLLSELFHCNFFYCIQIFTVYARPSTNPNSNPKPNPFPNSDSNPNHNPFSDLAFSHHITKLIRHACTSVLSTTACDYSFTYLLNLILISFCNYIDATFCF